MNISAAKVFIKVLHLRTLRKVEADNDNGLNVFFLNLPLKLIGQSEHCFVCEGGPGGGGKVGPDGEQGEAGGGHQGEEELHCHRPGNCYDANLN